MSSSTRSNYFRKGSRRTWFTYIRFDGLRSLTTKLLLYEMPALPDEDRPGDDASRSTPPGEDKFFQKMRVEEHQRRDFVEAFDRESSAHPGVADLVDIQRKNADQITQLHRTVGRLRRNMIVANLFSGSVFVALLVLAAFLSFRHGTGLSFTGEMGSGRDQLPGRNWTPAPTKLVPELVYESDLEFRIRTDVDRKYQLIIRHLYNNAKTLRRPVGPIEIQNDATDDYIQYMASVSKFAEEASEDQASPEILRAFVNLGLIGPQLRSVEEWRLLSVATQNQLDQIESVLRARDSRSREQTGVRE